MKEKANLVQFINHVANNNYKKADVVLADIVNEKIKRRIAEAYKKLDSTKGN